MQSNKISLFSLILASCALITCMFFCLLHFLTNNSENLNGVRAYGEEDVILEGEDLAPLSLYLKNIAGLTVEQTLQKNSFADTTELVFDGNSQLGENLISIRSLELFNWTNLVKIEIKNANQLDNVKLCNSVGNAFFPVLNEIIVENCPILKDLDTRGNGNVLGLTIKDCNALENLKMPSFNKVKQIKLNNLPNLRGEYNFTERVGDSFAKLESVNIQNVINFKELAFNGVALKELILKNSEALSIINISNASKLATCQVQNLINLKVFSISDAQMLGNPDAGGSIQFDVNDLNQLMLKSENLETFLLTNNNFITNLSLPNAMNLQLLTLSGCSNIFSLELNGNLNELTNLDLSNLKILSKLEIVNAEKLQEINLYNCVGLDPFNYPDFSSFENLVTLNLSYSSIDKLNLNNLSNLRTLSLQECEYLKNLSLKNLPNLDSFGIYDSIALKVITIDNCSKIGNVSFEGLKSLTDLTLKNIPMTEIKLNGLNSLMNCEFASANILSIQIENCSALKSVLFGNCSKLNELKLDNNPMLQNDISEELKNLNLLTSINISKCANLTQLSIENKTNLNELDISSLTNLFALSLIKIGSASNAQKTRIKLPTEFKKLKSITLKEMASCDFIDINKNETMTYLKVSNGILNKVVLSDVSFSQLNFSNNALIVVDLSNLRNLKFLFLQNNAITDFIDLDNKLINFNTLLEVNLHNNRIDFTDKKVFNRYKESSKNSCYILGLQNVLNNVVYNFEPTIYFAGFEGYDGNDIIKMEILKSSKIYDRIDFHNLSTSFKTFNIKSNALQTLSSGTYVIRYYRLKNNEKQFIMFGDVAYDNYQPMTFQVAITIDYIKYIWLFFVALAIALYVFVITMFLIEKSKLRKLKIDDDGLGEYELDFSKSDLKQMQREKRRRIKENIKNNVDNESDDYLQMLEEKIKNEKASKRVNLMSKKGHSKSIGQKGYNYEQKNEDLNVDNGNDKKDDEVKAKVNINKEKINHNVKTSNSIVNLKKPIFPTAQKDKVINPIEGASKPKMGNPKPVLSKMQANTGLNKTAINNVPASPKTEKPAMPKMPNVKKE